MHNELFGVFGDRSTFDRVCPATEFDQVIEAPSLTVGIRAFGLTEPGWTHTATGESGACVVWGESYLPAVDATPAEWLLEEYPVRGPAAIEAVNGSFVAVIDDGDTPIVVGDPIRSRECFYTDAAGARVFGTDYETIVSTLEHAAIDRRSVLEYLHLSVVLGDRTVFDSIDRIPFDSALTATGTEALDRFVYDAVEFDYVGSLARRLRRAIRRRRSQPGRSAVLLSAGYDSRVLVAELDDIDRSYTLGHPESAEVATSATIAAEYGLDHAVLNPRDGYLNTSLESVRYGQAVKESLQAHPAMDETSMAVDTVYHGLLFDTLLAGHFRPGRSIEVFGRSVPLPGLADDIDVADRLLADNFGFWDLSERDAFGSALPEASRAFCREALETQYERLADRFDRDADAVAALGVQNQPTLPFHTYLADNYFTPFVAADTELVEWHLHTPPEYRTRDTYRQAIARLDEEMMTPHPPDRPHSRYALNQLEGHVRKRMPGIRRFENPWPDRNTLYARAGLDEQLFGGDPQIEALPTRVKLRLNDVACWVDSANTAGDVGSGAVVDWVRNPQ